MADLFTVDVDASEVLRAFDELGDLVEEYALEVAMDTGRRIQTDARARLNRQTRGTGQTAENITVTDQLPSWLGGEQFADQKSVWVYARAVNRPDNLALWLEFGTKYMEPRPFLFNAARSEEQGHRRRLHQALVRAVEKVGGGR